MVPALTSEERPAAAAKEEEGGAQGEEEDPVSLRRLVLTPDPTVEPLRGTDPGAASTFPVTRAGTSLLPLAGGVWGGAVGSHGPK